MDTPQYKDLIIKAVLTKVEVKPAIEEVVKEAVLDISGNIKTPAEYKIIEPAVYALEIVTPFKRYSEEVWLDSENITYSYRTRLDLEGREVVVFTSAIDAHSQLPSEVAKAVAYKDTLATDWATAKANPKVIQHYALKKETALATSEKVGEVETTKPYTGADKAELYKPYGLFTLAADEKLK